MSGVHIIWFRDDLRVHDHAALRAACQNAERDGASVLALYILPAGTQSVSRFIYDGLPRFADRARPARRTIAFALWDAD